MEFGYILLEYSGMTNGVYGFMLETWVGFKQPTWGINHMVMYPAW
jgi:hypothetical protein